MASIDHLNQKGRDDFISGRLMKKIEDVLKLIQWSWNQITTKRLKKMRGNPSFTKSEFFQREKNRREDKIGVENMERMSPSFHRIWKILLIEMGKREKSEHAFCGQIENCLYKNEAEDNSGISDTTPAVTSEVPTKKVINGECENFGRYDRTKHPKRIKVTEEKAFFV